MIYGWSKTFSSVLLDPLLFSSSFFCCYHTLAHSHSFTVFLGILKHLLLMPACGVSVLTWNLRQFSQRTLKKKENRRENQQCWSNTQPPHSVCVHKTDAADIILMLLLCFVCFPPPHCQWADIARFCRSMFARKKSGQQSKKKKKKNAFKEDNNAHICNFISGFLNVSHRVCVCVFVFVSLNRFAFIFRLLFFWSV